MGIIAFAQSYADARSDKIARGLATQGIEVRRFLVDFDATWNPSISVGMFEDTFRLPEILRRHYYLGVLGRLSPRVLRRIIVRLPGKVVRTSTPDFFGVAAIRTGKHVVSEVYDTWSLYDSALDTSFGGRLRRTVLGRAERIVHEEADLVVYTTQEMLSYAWERYSIPKALVVPNAVLSADIPKTRLPKLSEDGRSHCVYVGLIHPSAESASRSMTHFFRELSKEHVVHVYGVADRAKEAEVRRDLDGIVRWHDPVPQRRLLEELTQYDFGLVLLPQTDARRFHTVIPNKIFEYVCAGLPVLVSPYRAMVNFVRKYNCGTVYGEGIPHGSVSLDSEFLLDTYLARYAEEIRRLDG